MRTSVEGGIDYAVHDINHDWYLTDDDADGTMLSWVPDVENATQCDTREDAESLAVIARVAWDEDDHVIMRDGYEIIEVPWVNVEDEPLDDLDRQLDANPDTRLD